MEFPPEAYLSRPAIQTQAENKRKRPLASHKPHILLQESLIHGAFAQPSSRPRTAFCENTGHGASGEKKFARPREIGQ